MRASGLASPWAEPITPRPLATASVTSNLAKATTRGTLITTQVPAP